MQLQFVNEGSAAYPHGFWYAVTEKAGFDADGPDPLTAVTRLAQVLEEELEEA